VAERLGLALIYMTSYSRTHESHQKLRLPDLSMVVKSFQGVIFLMALNWNALFIEILFIQIDAFLFYVTFSKGFHSKKGCMVILWFAKNKLIFKQ